MSTYVIDASIAVKWIFQENYYSEARRYLSAGINHIAPDFMLNECTSAIYKKYSRNEISEEQAIKALQSLIRYEDIHYYHTHVYQIRSFQIASQLQHPIFDCLYLALAEQENSIVVTADKRFYDRVCTSSYANYISWVEQHPVI